MLASIIIRTLNESKYLDELLSVISSQQLGSMEVEVIIVDSGSTDETLDIATKHKCNIVHIERKNFSFGRSLNMGCQISKGDILVMISGHCIPTTQTWLLSLCAPIIEGKASYIYGKQLGGNETYFSEARIFAKYFPECSQVPQSGYFCNNANSAISRFSWEQYGFNEDVTGLEDMELAKRLFNDGGIIGYVAEAAVYHHHSESWPQVRRRFEREAIALQRIMPHIQLDIKDMLRYMVSSIFRDCVNAKKCNSLLTNLYEIIMYRFNQYYGGYKGNQQHRLLSRSDKDKYFYPS